MKKLAIALVLAIALFSGLAAIENQRIKKVAEEEAAAAALLGNRAGGMVINAPSIQAPASPAATAPALSIPASDSSGAACP